jgi:hypothetical protein
MTAVTSVLSPSSILPPPSSNFHSRMEKFGKFFKGVIISFSFGRFKNFGKSEIAQAGSSVFYIPPNLAFKILTFEGM